MNGRKLATPGAILIFAGAFLLYWGLREFGVIGSNAGTAGSGGTGTQNATTSYRST